MFFVNIFLIIFLSHIHQIATVYFAIKTAKNSNINRFTVKESLRDKKGIPKVVLY